MNIYQMKLVAGIVLLSLLTFSFPSHASGVDMTDVYLNIDNISVSVGDGTSPGSFNNTFGGGQTIDKVIDAPSADAQEFHNQTTHIWFTADQVGGGLELVFDFNIAYDITTLHFWNFTGEGFDVDDIVFDFFNGANQVGSLEIQPDLGSSPGISAQDILLNAPLNVTSVVVFLSGSNGQVDFQNIGFTATASPVPAPAAVWLFISALSGMTLLRRREAH